MKSIFNSGVREMLSHHHHHHHHHQLLLGELVFSVIWEVELWTQALAGPAAVRQGHTASLSHHLKYVPVTLHMALRPRHCRFPKPTGQGRHINQAVRGYTSIQTFLPAPLKLEAWSIFIHLSYSPIYPINIYLAVTVGGGVCRTMDEKRNHMCQHMLSRGTFVSLQFPPLLLLIGIIPQEEISGWKGYSVL